MIISKISTKARVDPTGAQTACEGGGEVGVGHQDLLGWVVCMSSSILIIWLKRFTHQQCWRLWSLKVLLAAPNVEGGRSSDPGRDTGGWKGANAGEHVIIRIYMILISYPFIFMTERTDLIKMYYYTYMKSFGAKNQWFDDIQIEMFLRVIWGACNKLIQAHAGWNQMCWTRMRFLLFGSLWWITLSVSPSQWSASNSKTLRESFGRGSTSAVSDSDNCNCQIVWFG